MMVVTTSIIFQSRVRMSVMISVIMSNGIKYGSAKVYGIVIHYLNNGWKYLVITTIIISFNILSIITVNRIIIIMKVMMN
jgi:hypothetical protein